MPIKAATLSAENALARGFVAARPLSTARSTRRASAPVTGREVVCIGSFIRGQATHIHTSRQAARSIRRFLDGTLNLALVNGFSPALGKSFPVSP